MPRRPRPRRSRRCRCAASPSTTTRSRRSRTSRSTCCPGEVHALLGENGAGKSTLMNVASGATAPDGGTIVFDGAPVEHLTPAIAQDLGIAIVHQHPALLPDMTVAENILVAVGREHLRRRDPDATKAMRSLLDDVHFLGPSRGPRLVAQRRPPPPARARQGVRRLAAAPDPRRADRAALAGLRRAPLHRRPQARGGRDGRRLHHAPARRGARDRRPRHRPARRQGCAGRRPSRTSRTPTCSRMIIGRTLEATFPPKHAPAADEAPLLRVEGLSGHGFDEHLVHARARARSSGIAGVVGNGQPALLRALAGRDRGDRIGQRRRQGALAAGAARERGLHAGRPPHRGPDDRPERARERRADRARPAQGRARSSAGRREVDAVERELSELAVKAPSLEAPVSALSGGNQQKVVMARAMLSEPAILVADEPTQGVDVGARAEIYRILREVAARGVPVVVASSDAHGARGPVRPRDRDVARPGRRDARGRRRDRGADRPRRDQRDDAHRRAGGATRRAARRGSRASSRATTPRSSSSRS